jgi:hypothetical protein
MVVFESIAAYLGSCQSNEDKIAAIDVIIGKILVAAATAAESGHMDEYWYDDGHIKVRTKYRNMDSITKSLTSYQQLRNYYIAQITGRVFRLMDHKSFPPRC